MNSEVILEVAGKTLSGAMSFPDAVGKLMGAGVEFYHVDYVRLRKTCYSADGKTVTTPIALEGLPRVASELDVAALRGACAGHQRASVGRLQRPQRRAARGMVS